MDPGTLCSTQLRSMWLVIPSALAALLIGPTNPAVFTQRVALAAALLVAARLIWTIVRICLLMPAVLISHGHHSMSHRDRKLAQLEYDEDCVMMLAQTRFTVRRLRLQRGVDAVAVTHPRCANKWVVMLHGNGEWLLDGGFESKMRLAIDVGCSVIACDYREVGRSAGVLLAASDMVEDAATCVHFCQHELLGDKAGDGASILLFGQSMGGGVAAELAALRFPHLPCVNMRSFCSLADVADMTVGALLAGIPGGASAAPRR